MEKNTFATSAYIGVPSKKAFAYLADLQTLGEWTLGSRMCEKVDENTWVGTASGYQNPLYYHIQTYRDLHRQESLAALERLGVRCIEASRKQANPGVGVFPHVD